MWQVRVTVSRRTTATSPSGLRLPKTREAVGYLEELFAYRLQMAEAFLKAEVREVVRANFIAQERGELLVLFDECVLPVRPENVMTVFNLLQRSVQLALQLLRDAAAEDLGDLVSGHPPQTDLAGALEDQIG